MSADDYRTESLGSWPMVRYHLKAGASWLGEIPATEPGTVIQVFPADDSAANELTN